MSEPVSLRQLVKVYGHQVAVKGIDLDIEKGSFNQKQNMPKDCKVENFKMSGNTATYTMQCTGDMKMKGDNKITFNDSGFVMDQNMAMDHGGQVMKTRNHMESRYLGPCK